MSIKADLDELNGIEHELKSLRARLKHLNSRKKMITERVKVYIRSKDLPGVKHQGMAILLEEKEGRAKKAPKQRNEDAMSVLERYGITDAETALKEIMEARKGEKIPVDKLKVKKYKNK